MKYKMHRLAMKLHNICGQKQMPKKNGKNLLLW